MLTGAYMLGSTGIKYKDQHQQKLVWLPDGPPVRGRSEPGMIRERAELVYQQVPSRMKNLVIINSSFSDFECIQAAADIGEKYADNVVVITSLMSRLTYALSDLAQFWNPPENEVILIITLTSVFAEFVILRRDESFQLYVAECFDRKSEECIRIFPEIYNDFFPHATVFLVQDDYDTVANDLKTQYQPENCFIKPFRRWDFPILWGGIFYGGEGKEFDPRYLIKNFANGIETNIGFGRSQKRQILLPDRTPVPCDIYGFDGTPDSIQAQQLSTFSKHDSAGGAEIKSSNVNFLFKNDHFGIEVYKNGVIERIKNSEGNDWTPLYFSMANGSPEIGEKAKNDYQIFPKSVIYDVLKIIGKPFNEIIIDPKWGFKLDKKNGIIYFEIETPSDGAQFSQELVVSVFLKEMKLRAESNMGTQ
uniref:Uncharacterized protein n=1 Tax=Panagrolaimus sp. ES5 TaxID=591445 RepID=A0AC34G3L9_9BILA